MAILSVRVGYIFVILILLISTANATTYYVYDRDQWDKLQIRPGDVVKVGIIKNAFLINVSGTKEKPIKIIGIGSFSNSDYGLVLKNTSFVELEGFSFNGFNVGIVLINSSNVSISNINVSNCGYGVKVLNSKNISVDKINSYGNKIGFYCKSCGDLLVSNSSFNQNGGGVLIEHVSNLTIRDLNVSSNERGLIVKTNNAVIKETTISNNTRGLELWGNMKIVNCLISFNSNGATLHGNFTIQNCDFVRNAVKNDYALEIFGDAIVENSIFAFNGNDSAAIFVDGNFTSRSSIYYNNGFEIFFANSSQLISKDDVNNKLLGNNSAIDPKFVNFNDFHLLKNSPAVDNGIPTINIDLDHNVRPWGEGYDIGCYELIYQIIKNVTPFQAYQLIKSKDITIIDIRTPREFYSGHIANAINIDFYSPTFKQQLNKLDKNKAYLIYCRTGHRTGMALDVMKELGFMEVYNMLGGITKWVKQGYPIVR